MKNFHIITFGCQMNHNDSLRLATVLESFGWQETTLDRSNLIIVNACSIRQSGIDRIWGMAKGWLKQKESKGLKILLTGCVLAEDKKIFAKRFDLVFDIKELNVLENFLQEKFSNDPFYSFQPKKMNSAFAYVPIMTGCNNFCSYCVVPYTRGREQSRSVIEILAEIENLVKEGIKEVHLLGQNVNSYSPADFGSFSVDNPYQNNFAKLLFEVNQIEGVKRIHFSSSHPKDMSDDLIEALSLSKMVNYLHLPLQSGDDDILQKMNRNYSTADFFKIVEKVRKVKPEIAIGTDIIVGFCGETEEQFKNSLKFYEKVGFDICFLAMYSERVGTLAEKMSDDIPLQEKKRRWHELQKLMKKIVYQKNQKYLDREIEILIDLDGTDFWEGNIREMKRARVNKSDFPEQKIGDLIVAKVKDPKEWILYC